MTAVQIRDAATLVLAGALACADTPAEPVASGDGDRVVAPVRPPRASSSAPGDGEVGRVVAPVRPPRASSSAPGDGEVGRVVAPVQAHRPTPGDRDADGLDDAREATLARDYLPYLSDDPDEACGRSGIVFRARPHPADPALVSIVYVRIYHEDCGVNGHIGDDEVFGITVDPRRPVPDGVLGMVAIGHQDTLCEQVTACGRCPGQAACATAPVDGRRVPVVFASRNKHANYVLAGRCTLAACLDRCALAPAPTVPPLVNAGEPDLPLVRDLGAHFITGANGWTHAALQHLDPWDPSRRVGGGATGTIASRLVDPDFVAPACDAG